MKLTTNRKAYFHYEILDTFEAGIKLLGTEIKSLRSGGGSLDSSFAKVSGNELFLVNASIAPFEFGNIHNHEERRERKLLMHKNEILKLRQKLQEKGLALVPLSLYLKNGKVKVELALAKGKKGPDKRKAIREQEEKRQIAQMIKKHR